MADKIWKVRERSVAKGHGSERTPLSGGNGKQTRSDSLSAKFFIESKHRKSQAIFSLYKSVKPLAKKEGKIPVIALTEHRSHGYITCIHSDSILDYCKEYLQIHGYEITGPTAG